MASEPALAVLDISGFRARPDGPGGRRFVEELRDAAHTVGFFYLEGHGVPELLDRDLFAVARRFFDLPETDRLAIENVNSPQFRGYTRLGHEYTNGVSDLRDQLDISHELPPPDVGSTDPAWLRLRGPNLWPDGLPDLRPIVTEWMDQLEGVGRTLLHAVALALGQPADHFDAYVTPRPEVLTKVIRYVATEQPSPTAAPGQGVGSHRDTGFLSFVAQHQVGGLQVERDGRFVDVAPREGAFVVNLGEMLQLVSHGYLAATVHRVVSPPTGTERLVVAYFFNPRLEATVAAVELPPELAAEAPGGESVDPANPILAHYGENSLKVRLRAHPDVAARHHADLLDAARD